MKNYKQTINQTQLMHSKILQQVFNDQEKLKRLYNVLLLTIIYCPREHKGPVTRSQGKWDLFVPSMNGNRGPKSDQSTFTFAREFLLKNEIVGWRVEPRENTQIAHANTQNGLNVVENFPFEVNF